MFLVSKNEEIAVQHNEELDVPALMAIAQHPDLKVLAMRSYCEPDGVVLHLVTNNPVKTARLLKRVGYKCWTKPVLLVGPLSRHGCTVPLQAELEASGVQVRYSYTHRTERGQLYLAFKTEEDDRALRVLEVSSTLQEERNDKADGQHTIGGSSGLEQLHEAAA
jgi:hypothetical protein